MDAQSQRRALNVALQTEAEAMFNSSGEIVLVESGSESDLEFLVTSGTKCLKLTCVLERNAVRWETPKEYGFEPLSGAGPLAVTLMRLVHRR